MQAPIRAWVKLQSSPSRMRADTTKCRSLAVFLVFGGLVSSVSAGPIDVLRELFTTAHRTPVVMVQSFRQSDGSVHQLKVHTTADGRTRRTVIQPLAMQGEIYYDDGKKWYYFRPDQRVVIQQPSPVLNTLDINRRLALVNKNYTLNIGKTEVIVGRPATKVIAKPKFKGLPTRIYYVDKEFPALLRLQTSMPNSKETIMAVDTHSFQALSGESALTQSPPDDAGYRLIKMWGPKNFDPEGKYAERFVGFSPTIPNDLPFGFELAYKQMIGTEDAPYVSVRITDGLSSLSVYLVDRKRPGRLPFPVEGSIRAVNSVIFCAGDASAEVRRRCAEAFAKAQK